MHQNRLRIPRLEVVAGTVASDRTRTACTQEAARFWEFGGGTLADMGCHYMDLPFGPSNLARPKTRPTRLSPHIPSTPKDLHCHGRSTTKGTSWSFIGTTVPDAQTACQGDLREWSARQLEFRRPFRGRGQHGSCRLWTPLPAARTEVRGLHSAATSIPSSIGHHREWLEAIRTGGPTTCHFAYSGNLTQTVLLGNQAYQGRITRSDGACPRPRARHHSQRPWAK